jgi:hypothetical protein
MLRRAGVSGARLDRGSDEAVGASTGSAKQNTIDLQSKMRANYNARPCDGERKAAVPRTMASNGKNNAQSNGNSRKSGRVLTSGCDRGKTGNDAARAAVRRTGFVGGICG